MGASKLKRLHVTLNQSQCQNELNALNKVDNEAYKYSLFRAGLELIQLNIKNEDFDIYNTRIWNKLSKEQAFKYILYFDIEQKKELALYNDISKLTTIERKIFLRNVVVHAGRKLIKAFDPNSTIYIYELATTSAPVVNVQVKNEVMASKDDKFDLGDFT